LPDCTTDKESPHTMLMGLAADPLHRQTEDAALFWCDGARLRATR